MQPFTCPQCGHESRFDPWADAARCPACGFTPPGGGPSGEYIRWARRQAYQPYLDELLAHWNGTHRPDQTFTLESQDDAVRWFHAYQRALGEDPRAVPGPHVQYTREYHPSRAEVLTLAGAYLWLRRGKRETAARDLEALAFTSPDFVDAWVWLTATTDDPDRRRDYLEKATRRDVGHPLARDALALAQGRVPLDGEPQAEQVVVTQCPQCGAGLRYEPGARQVHCAHCGHQVALHEADVVDGPARAVSNLRLKRRHEGHTWAEAQRVLHCRTCGADLTMTRHLAQHCAFCGSTNVLVEDSRRKLEQPDGLLPFHLDEAQAAEVIRETQNALANRLVSWLTGRRQQIEGMEGVYLPFWVFDGMVEVYRFSRGFATASKETLGLTTVENLPLPATAAPPPDLQRDLLPFAWQALVPYEPRLLADWPARIYDQDVELVSERARNLMVGRVRSQEQMLNVGSRQRAQTGGQQAAYQVLGTTYQLILLPVWLGRLAGDDGVRLALVNGQSGKVALEGGLLGG